MSTFSTQRLLGTAFLVSGVDANGVNRSATLDGTQYLNLKKHETVKTAQSEADEAIKSFFAPVIEVAETLKAAVAATEEADPITYIVIEEAIAGVSGRPEQRLNLTNDTVILRLIESGDVSRLVWHGDEILVLAQ